MKCYRCGMTPECIVTMLNGTKIPMCHDCSEEVPVLLIEFMNVDDKRLE